jgi:glycosyltransferase involved in cell wall biosynthesis
LKRSEAWLLSERFRDALPVHSTAVVVHNGINCSGREHDKIVESSSMPRDGPIQLVFFSNRTPTKGVRTAIDVSSQLLAQHPEALRVTFAGFPMDQSVENALERLVKKHPLEVSVLDGVESEAKCRLLGRADILLMPSRYPLEGAPLVLIEALMHGAFCVVTDHAALPEIVGASGSVVNDEAGIIDAYNTFAALRPDERQRIRVAAIERWQSHFSAEIYRGRVADRLKAGAH